jgi:hypothetical protein
MPADISIEKAYKVGSAKVFLSLVIGEGQFGRSDVRLGTQRLLRASGPIGDLFIGKGGDIVGQTLRIRSKVDDTVSATNRMSVTYKLTGGTADKEFVSRGEVERDGANLIFEAKFSFE